MLNSAERRCHTEPTSVTLIAHHSSTNVNTAARASRSLVSLNGMFAYIQVRETESESNHVHPYKDLHTV